jgi:hypothetical protein
MHRRFRIVLAVLLVAAPSARAAVPTYSTIELRARSNIVDGYRMPAGSSFNSGTPSLNDAGALAFRLIVVGNTGNAGLWYGKGAAGGVVYGAPAGPILTDPFVNAAGRTSFEQTDFGLSDGVFVYDPVTGMTQQEVVPGGIFGIDGFGDPQINDAGVIGFRADQGAQNALIFDDGGTQTFVAFEGGGGVGYLFSPEFDNLNRFHVKVRLGGIAGSDPDQIRRYNPDGTFTVMAEDDDGNPLSPFSGFSNGVGCSRNSGLVAFTAQLVGGGEGVYVSDGTTITPIATTANPAVSSIDFFAPQVNDDGVAAFRAFDAAGLRVIYAGDGTTLRRVVGEHDVVDTDLGAGRIDQNDSSPVFGGSVAINGNGDVAFAATLTPENNNQIEWGTGMFVAVADAATAGPVVAGAADTLLRVSPNPFRDAARVTFTLPRAGAVRLELVDVTGRRIATLVDGERPAGTQTVGLPAGLRGTVFFARLTGPGVSGATRIVRIR